MIKVKDSLIDPRILTGIFKRKKEKFDAGFETIVSKPCLILYFTGGKERIEYDIQEECDKDFEILKEAL